MNCARIFTSSLHQAATTESIKDSKSIDQESASVVCKGPGSNYLGSMAHRSLLQPLHSVVTAGKHDRGSVKEGCAVFQDIIYKYKQQANPGS